MDEGALNHSVSLTAVRFEDGIVRPWLTTRPTPGDGKPIEMRRSDVTEIWPFADFLTDTQYEFDKMLQVSGDAFSALLKETEHILKPRRLSIPDRQLMRPVPITPHTKKTRRARRNESKNFVPSEEQPNMDLSHVVATTIEDIVSAEGIKATSTRPKRAAAKRNTYCSRTNSSVQDVATCENSSSVEAETTNCRPKRAAAKKKAVSTGTRRVATRSSKTNASLIVLPGILEETVIVNKSPTLLKQPQKKQKTVTINTEHVSKNAQELSAAPTLEESLLLASSGRPSTDSDSAKVSSQDLPTQDMDVGNHCLTEEMEVNDHGLLHQENNPDGDGSSSHSSNVDHHDSPLLEQNADGKGSLHHQENTDGHGSLGQETNADGNSLPLQKMNPDDDGSAPQENDGQDHSPSDVRQLISLHETLIGIQSGVKNNSNKTYSELHASPELSTGVAAEVNCGSARSMKEQIHSCKKKNPVVKLAKLSAKRCSLEPVAESPRQGPITLTLDGSDEEDAADSVTVKVTDGERSAAGSEIEDSLDAANNLPSTPAGICSDTILPPRRSLALRLRLSSSEDDLDDVVTSSGELARHDSEPRQPMADYTSDSLDEMEKNENRPASEDVSKTISQASSSVCSSSAATVVLEDILQSAAVSQSSSSEDEKPKKLSESPVRRSVRIGKNVGGGGSHNGNAVVALKSMPRIAKPVIRKPARTETQKNRDKQLASGTESRAAKRNLEMAESAGLQSPDQKKTKYMGCGSPLCRAKSKTKPPAQSSRSTFLNRSTAASRSRRTPGRSSPAVGTRTRATLHTGTPFNFDKSQTVCLTPMRQTNLAIGVTSFIRRNTPQKVNYEEQLAAKKEQLEEKRKREHEAKRRKEEIKKQKILEKKRKRSERLRKAAMLREKVEREKEEKQLKNVEQWEKRVADVDKVKILRKKEETAKVRKLEKKQAEAEEIRRKEEEGRIKKLREQEQERERRLLEQKAQKEQEAAARKQAEIEKQFDKQRQEKLREEAEAEEARKRVEEERKKREEEEKLRRKKADEAHKLKQQKVEKEEAEKRRKIQEEIEKRNAEATRLEQERVEKEKEAQQKQREDALRKQEETIRRKEKEEARKRKLEEAKAAAEAKARKRKQEELAKAEEARRKREEIRKEAERRREEERHAEKVRQEEEKRKRREEAEKEKLRKIQEGNAKLKKLEEEHRREKELLKSMGHDSSAVNKSLLLTPAPAANSTFVVNPNASRCSPQSYDITPQIPKPVLWTEDNYNIDDLSSGDETDDDEKPRKPVPRWAKGAPLKNSLIQQYYKPPNMPEVFRDALDFHGAPGFKGVTGFPLDEIFNSYKLRYFKRTSSAHWNSPIMPVDHISFTEQCRGFDSTTN